MLRRLLPILAGVALSLASAFADDRQPIPDLHARVTDLTNTLDGSQKQTLESDLEALEKRKGAQIGVLIVPTTQPEDIAQYAIRVFDAWKLGRKGIDDGALLVVAKNDHRVRIEVARGLEGAIPDAAAARIIREYITPKFRAGDFYGGIHDATDTLTKLVDGEQLPPPMTANDDRSKIGLPDMIFIGLFGAIWLRGFLGFLPSAARGATIGGIAGVAAWVITQALGISLGLAFIGFIIGALSVGVGRYAGSGGLGGWSGGGGGWSSGGGGFSGGGGISAGGGASGSW